MAAIDKIYCTKEQREELEMWCADNLPGALQHFYPEPDYERYGTDRQYPMTNFPEWVDRQLWLNCPLPFVQERLAVQYNEDTRRAWEDEE